MKQLTIFVDLDAIVIDLIRPWLGWYNAKYEDNVTVDEIVQYKVDKFCKKTNVEGVFAFFEEHANYANCPVLPGAAEALKELDKNGHDVIIATATAGQTAHLKWHLVNKAAPWFNENDVMVGSRKEKLFGDVFIDDAPKNIVRYRNAWPSSHILTIAYPYNRDCRSLVNLYAQDHNNTDKAWAEICGYIHELSSNG